MGKYSRGLMLVVAVCLATLDAPCEGQTQCPGKDEPWREYNGRYYHVRKSLLNYPDAYYKCEALNGMLASVPTEGLNTFLKNLLEEEQVAHAWIGLVKTVMNNKDPDVEVRRQKWDWIDVYAPTFTYGESFHDWKGVEPQKNDKCTRIGKVMRQGAPVGQHRWYGRPCRDENFFICERDTQCAPVPTCPDGWKGFEDSCYLYLVQTGYYPQAVETCKSLNASVLTITGPEEKAFIESLEEWSIGLPTWLGLTRAPGQPCVLLNQGDHECFNEGWIWQDGSPLSWKDWDSLDIVHVDDATNFAIYHRSNVTTLCAKATKILTGEFHWYTQQCHDSCMIMCKKSLYGPYSDPDGDTSAIISAGNPVSSSIAVCSLTTLLSAAVQYAIL